MPKTNFCKSVNTNKRKDERVNFWIYGLMAQNGIKTIRELSRLSGLDERLLSRRLKNPCKLELGELRKIMTALEAPNEYKAEVL